LIVRWRPALSILARLAESAGKSDYAVFAIISCSTIALAVMKLIHVQVEEGGLLSLLPGRGILSLGHLAINLRLLSQGRFLNLRTHGLPHDVELQPPPHLHSVGGLQKVLVETGVELRFIPLLHLIYLEVVGLGRDDHHFVVYLERGTLEHELERIRNLYIILDFKLSK